PAGMDFRFALRHQGNARPQLRRAASRARRHLLHRQPRRLARQAAGRRRAGGAAQYARRSVRRSPSQASRPATRRAAQARRPRRTGAQRRAHVGDTTGDPLRLAGTRRTHRRDSGNAQGRRVTVLMPALPRYAAIIACWALLPAALALALAQAQTAIDFYRGKQITLVTSASVGGGYDQYARLLARHMQRHIPGEPAIIVREMVGAAGLRAANYLYNVAAQD